mmetsp:Transcript_53450/g.153354  ORF Transcript_53450/g.153354 Transcript_53450/m.153354 type:complete len:233 (+) Transcript_53450:160-858(+)
MKSHRTSRPRARWRGRPPRLHRSCRFAASWIAWASGRGLSRRSIGQSPSSARARSKPSSAAPQTHCAWWRCWWSERVSRRESSTRTSWTTCWRWIGCRAWRHRTEPVASRRSPASTRFWNAWMRPLGVWAGCRSGFSPNWRSAPGMTAAKARRRKSRACSRRRQQRQGFAGRRPLGNAGEHATVKELCFAAPPVVGGEVMLEGAVAPDYLVWFHLPIVLYRFCLPSLQLQTA